MKWKQEEIVKYEELLIHSKGFLLKLFLYATLILFRSLQASSVKFPNLFFISIEADFIYLPRYN
jgi:hypothetical protein